MTRNFVISPIRQQCVLTMCSRELNLALNLWHIWRDGWTKVAFIVNFTDWICDNFERATMAISKTKGIEIFLSLHLFSLLSSSYSWYLSPSLMKPCNFPHWNSTGAFMYALKRVTFRLVIFWLLEVEEWVNKEVGTKKVPSYFSER